MNTNSTGLYKTDKQLYTYQLINTGNNNSIIIIDITLLNNNQNTIDTTPWVANNVRNTLMVDSVDVEGTINASIHFEYESTTIRKVCPIYGPA